MGIDKKCIIIRTISFSIVMIIILVGLEKIFFNSAAVCDTWEDIQNPMESDPDILFLGNSHIYTSINPEIINESTGLKVEILGSASQNSIITLSNLEIALRYKKPKCIILEANVILSDNMEELINEKRGYIINLNYSRHCAFSI